MLFPTLSFGLFFIVVFALSWSLRNTDGLRKFALLAASYFFYGCWDWRFTALLAGSSSLNYIAGLALARAPSERARSIIAGVAVALNLLVIGAFKYYGFFIESLASLLDHVGLARDLPFLEVILPVGISFFTFHGISYVVDVRRREVEPVSSPLDLFLYISFFPQLVAGPIVRAAYFLPQLRQKPQLDAASLAYSVVLILSGLFKKTVVAGYLASDIVDQAFQDPSGYSAIDLVLAVYAYAMQIYCDFSGYTDIAIGLAALLGYRFKANFNQPYRSASLREFWRRWHISLSEWLRDYLYKPLGGSKYGELATYRNLLMTMLLGGIWHGAAWNFVVWGGIHGTALAAERYFRSRWMPDTPARAPGRVAQLLRAFLGSIGHICGIVLTFNIVCLAWIFFRSSDIGAAFGYLTQIAKGGTGLQLTTPFVLGLTGLTLAAQFLPTDSARHIARQIEGLRGWHYGVLLGLGLAVMRAIGPEGIAPFIYFQF